MTATPIPGPLAPTGASTTQPIDAQALQAVATAQAALTEAKAALDAAKRDYAATAARYSSAKMNADSTRRRAEVAETNARSSASELLLAVRGGAGQSPGGAPGGLLFGAGAGNLLQKLSALHQLGMLNAAPSELSLRASHDAAAAKTARAQAGAAAAVLATIPLSEKHATMNAAQDAVDTAQGLLDTAQADLASFDSALTASDFSYVGLLGDTAWVDPVKGPITDVFGPRPSRPLGTALFHPGDDIGAACGTWIVAAAAGTVIDTGPYSGYGNWVVIDHGDGVRTVYGHIMDGGTAVVVGQQVLAGQPIARVGSTGLSTGCHLHLEVRVDGQQIDPQPFFAARGVIVGS